MHLSLHQERVSPTGSIMSVGILNQLGRPNLDLLAVLVREAAQNSWDARSSDDLPVFFGINGWTLSTDQLQFLKDMVFAELPHRANLPLVSLFDNALLTQALVLYDRGTTGLSGTTRADEVPDVGESSNFVNFLRNVGQPSGRAYSGGTYGYGKAAFYRASQARTICVYTRSRYRGNLETRFMAASLGEPYTLGQIRHTGRFWWGIQDSRNSDVIEPALNEEADYIAAALGLPLFHGDECGTDILVLQPYLGDLTPIQAANLMAENILWYFWPKLMSQTTGYPSMQVEVTWDGQRVEMPLPETYPPLRGFVEAMYAIRGGTDEAVSNTGCSLQTLSTTRPKQNLGMLALQEISRSSKTAFDTGLRAEENIFSQLHHHTALMRQPQLVVKYMPGVPLTDETKGYAGVFVTNAEIDTIFASAEPPTHDEWIPSSLEERHHRTYVNQALKQIERSMSVLAASRVDEAAAASPYYPANRIARSLGDLLLRSSTTQPVLNGVSRASLTQEPQISSVQGNEDLPRLIPITPSPHQSDLPQTQLLPNVYEMDAPTSSAQDGQLIGLRSQNSRERAHVSLISQKLMITDSGLPAVKVDFTIQHSQSSSGTFIQLEVSVLIDGNTRESAPPVGQEQPSLLYWIDPVDRRYPQTQMLFVPSDVVGVCSAVVHVPSHTLLRIELITAVTAENG